MPNPRIVDYLRKYQGQYNINQLRQALQQQGYSSAEIEEGIIEARQPAPSVSTTDPSTSASGFDNLFVFDQQTKETMLASIVALVIAEVIIFFGDYLVGNRTILSLVTTIIYALFGGAISGWVLSKFYHQLMGFVSQKMKFLLPFSNTFFKLLFLPVLIGSVIGLVMGLLAGGAIFAIGASFGGVGGGVLGGLLGGSLILSMIWSIVVEIAARYFYAKYITWKVGKYYHDYKDSEDF